MVLDFRPQNLRKQRAGQLLTCKLEAGLIGVLEYLSGKIREGYGIKHEEARRSSKESSSRSVSS
jgi:hypothetical protein